MFGGVWHQGEAGGVQYGGGPTCTAETRERPVQCSIDCIGVGGYIQFLPAVGSRETLVQLSKLPAMKSGEYHIKVQSQSLIRLLDFH